MLRTASRARGDLFSIQRRYEKAIAEYDKAIDARSAFPRLALSIAAWPMVTLGDESRAKADIDKALEFGCERNDNDKFPDALGPPP